MTNVTQSELSGEAEFDVSKGQLAWTTFLLSAVSLFNYMDRYGISILVEPIKADLQLSDTQLGLLTGFAFSLTYGLFGIPLGRLADTGHRVRLLAVCLAIWSAATAAMGAANNFIQLAITRVFVGIGEAGGTPSSNSLIGDYYPPETRARGLSLFTFGGTIGSTVGLALIGIIADQFGWRTAFVFMGVPGVVLAVVLLMTVREPPRGRFQAVEQAPNVHWWDGVKAVLNRMTMRHMIAGYAISAFGSLGIGAWQAAFFIRVHGLTLTEIGTALGVLVGLAAVAGTLIGAVVGPMMVKRDRRWELWWPATAYMICIPLYVVAFMTDHLWTAYAMIGIASITVYTCVGLLMSGVQSVLPADARAIGIALIMFAGGLFGAGIGPLLVGFLSDYWSATYGVDGLRYAIVVGIGFIFWGVLHFFFASKYYLDDLVS